MTSKCDKSLFVDARLSIQFLLEWTWRDGQRDKLTECGGNGSIREAGAVGGVGEAGKAGLYAFEVCTQRSDRLLQWPA